jgi:hypothetical protein
LTGAPPQAILADARRATVEVNMGEQQREPQREEEREEQKERIQDLEMPEERADSVKGGGMKFSGEEEEEEVQA